MGNNSKVVCAGSVGLLVPPADRLLFSRTERKLSLSMNDLVWISRRLCFLRRAIRSLLRFPANALVASSSNLGFHIDSQLRRTDALHENPMLSAKLYPPPDDIRMRALIDRTEQATRVTGEVFPVPPQDLMEGYGPSIDRYLISADDHFARMKALVEASGLLFGDRNLAGLDFGCAAGRLIRRFAPHAAEKKFYGVDISVSHIEWCQRHLSPPFTFLNTTTFPHLPFADRSFDLIYAGSVFTHISNLADMWILELARLLKPGGRIYLTVHDRNSVRILREKSPDFFLCRIANDLDRETGFMSRPFGMVTHRRSAKHAMVFYEESFLKEHWGQYLKVYSYTHEAYGYQSAVVLGT